MAFEAIPGPFSEVRGLGTVGGTALTTTSTCVAFPPGSVYLALEPRNFATGVVAQVAFCPWLTVLLTTDALATVANLTDVSENVQGSGTVATLNSFASTSAIWVGSHLPFRGLFVDVTNTNTNVSALSGTYYNGTAMTDISITDGTASGGRTLNADGLVTWTVPTDWQPESLRTLGSAATSIRRASDPLYWVKFVVTAALDASVSVVSMLALARSTAYMQLATGREKEFAIKRGERGVGGIECKIDAGTGALLATVGAVSMFP